MSIEVTLALVRETKNTLVFQQVDDGGKAIEAPDPRCAIGTLYIQKVAFPSVAPMLISVTVTSVSK